MKKKLPILFVALIMIVCVSLCACDALVDNVLGIIADHLNIIVDVTLSETEIEMKVGDTKTVTATPVGVGDWSSDELEYKMSVKNIVTIAEKFEDDNTITYTLTATAAGNTSILFYMPYENETVEFCTLSVVVTESDEQQASVSYDLSDIPEFDGETAYVILNNNIPFFTEEDMMTEAYEYYSELDDLGRCGMTIACVCLETMPTEPRGEIGSVKPTGWHTVKYDCVSGKYLYNRCHLIGYQLTAENANRQNLITGTRFLNIDGNLVFENMVADYVKETGNHVMYRVTPIFEGDNLLASGVIMEGYSVEDDGEGICYNVYCYNAQPGIYIDYATGDSHLLEE